MQAQKYSSVNNTRSVKVRARGPQAGTHNKIGYVKTQMEGNILEIFFPRGQMFRLSLDDLLCMLNP